MLSEGSPDDEKRTTCVRERVQEDASPSLHPRRERSLVRKLDQRILPITCLMYLCSCEYLLLLSGVSYPRYQIWTEATWEMLVFKGYPKTHLVVTPQALGLPGLTRRSTLHMYAVDSL
jgi:hypothetical protein